MPAPIQEQKIEQHFWSCADTSAGPDGCWCWKLTKNAKGYGKYGRWRKSGEKYAHRMAAKLSGMEIPKGHHVCHKCDNPSCVNPKHLFVGTPLDNVKDCQKKGRAVPPPRVKPPTTKLCAEKVHEIRNCISRGMSDYRIAPLFDVSEATIWRIRHGICWRNV